MTRVNEPPASPGISIIIPNWNGRDFLPKCISALREAAKNYSDTIQITVVDNGSSDGSIEFLAANFPQVDMIRFRENKGFAFACNEGVTQAKHDKILLLNNDAEVAADFLAPLLEHFRVDGSLFAVSCRLLFSDTKRLNFGRTAAKFKHGVLTLDYLDDVHKSSCYTFVASGAASLIDRQKFLELGGFDTGLFYYEDVDLSYRAWKRGWKIVYEPSSVVYHENQGTSSKMYQPKEIDKIIARSRFLFMWKNIRDTRLLLTHYLQLPFVLAASPLLGRAYLLSAFWDALKKKRSLPASSTGEYRLSDSEVLSFLRQKNE